MNDERGGDGPSDAWKAAEGHVGAAPPPTWARPEGWTPPAPGSEPGSTWASDTPPQPGTHDVVDDAPRTPLTDYRKGGPNKRKPYGVGTFGDNDTYYNRRRRYLGRRRPVSTYASGRGPTSYKGLAWAILLGTVLSWTGVVPLLTALLCWLFAFNVRRNAPNKTFRSAPARAWMVGSILLSVLAVGGMLLLILVEIPSGNSLSGTNYPDSADLTGNFGTAYTLQAQASYGPAKHDPFVPVRITAANYRSDVNLAQSPDVTATVDLTLCATSSALDYDEIRDSVHLTGPSGDEIETVDDMPGAGESPEIYRHSCVDLPVGFHVPKGSDVDTLEYDPIPQTISWALPAPSPSP